MQLLIVLVSLTVGLIGAPRYRRLYSVLQLKQAIDHCSTNEIIDNRVLLTEVFYFISVLEVAYAPSKTMGLANDLSNFKGLAVP